MPDGLAAFIAERLDEDEALATLNIKHGLQDDEKTGPGFPDYRTYNDADTDAADDYIGHFRPRRMLRAIAAKRAILAGHPAEPLRHIDAHRCPTCETTWPCTVVRAIAAIDSDHPDYLPEWAPATAQLPATAP